jgi:hypothetical protein
MATPSPVRPAPPALASPRSVHDVCPENIAALEQGMRDPILIVKIKSATAFYLLTKNSEKVLPLILHACGEPSGILEKKCILNAIREIGPDATKALPFIEEQLRSESQSLKLAALNSLRSFRLMPMSTISAVADLLEDDDLLVFVQAKASLKGFGPSVLHSLLQRINHAGPKAKCAICEIIATFGREGMSALPTIRTLLQDDNPVVRMAAEKALVRLGR